MFRRSFIIFSVMILFLLAMTACSKKTTDAPMTDPEPVEVAPEPEPEPEVTEEPAPEPEVNPIDMLSLEDVFFEFDKSDLSAEARRKLESNANQLKDVAEAMIVIEGHCDERGTTAYNLALGERRAKATADYLKSLGVAGSRIEVISYGEERPFAMGNNEQAWAQNRRAHFKVKG